MAGSETIRKLDRANLWDQSYSVLKEMIIKREFPPNEKLSIPELSTQLGVSRTPIRDALQRLEVDGLVQTVSKVGTYVRGITEDFVKNIMDTRMMIEYWTADGIPKLPREKVIATADQMDTVLSEAVELLHSPSFKPELLVEDNLRFHLSFVALGGNEYTVQIYSNALNYGRIASHASLISKEMIETAYQQHRDIVSALRAGDRTELKEKLRLHLMDSRERLIKNIQEHGGEV